MNECTATNILAFALEFLRKGDITMDKRPSPPFTRPEDKIFQIPAREAILAFIDLLHNNK